MFGAHAVLPHGASVSLACAASESSPGQEVAADDRSGRALRDPLRRRGPRAQLLQGPFDWQIMEMPDMGYTMVMTGPSGDTGPTEPGFINGGMLNPRRQPRQRPGRGPRRRVIDAALAEIEGPGGSIVVAEDAGGRHGLRRLLHRPGGQRRRPLGDRRLTGPPSVPPAWPPPGSTTADELNALLPGTLPGLLGLTSPARAGPARRRASTSAPTCWPPTATCTRPPSSGLADTACGLATRALLPDGASGFTTIELKSNFLGTARDGRIEVVASNAHAGRTTQVWDAEVTTRARARRSRCSGARSRCCGRVTGHLASNPLVAWATDDVRLAPHQYSRRSPWSWPARIPDVEIPEVSRPPVRPGGRPRSGRTHRRSSTAGTGDAMTFTASSRPTSTGSPPALAARGLRPGRRARPVQPEHPLLPGRVPRHRRGRHA